MFGAFKTRGFNFEETHFKNLQRIKKLLFVVSIAYFWSIMVGLWLEKMIRINIKNHGRRAIITFLLGFRYLTYIIKNYFQKLEEFNVLTKLLSCT